ncbi:hypothetical protein RZS08_50495, partial [Arthrospira platensis SPKY1]|nr:hypothetical protein [Arthrospira platensis SPKY1]
MRIISEGFADHLELTGDNSQDAGASQMVTISAKMLGGGTDTSYSGVHEITFSGALASETGNAPTCRDRNGVDRSFGTPTELLFTDGVATCRMYLYRAGL